MTAGLIWRPKSDEDLQSMVERFPGHAYLVAALIGAGALWLLVSQIISIFVP